MLTLEVLLSPGLNREQDKEYIYYSEDKELLVKEVQSAPK